MNSKILIQTQDQDLGKTISLWLSQDFSEFFAAHPEANIIITDSKTLGRPYQKSKEYEEFRVGYSDKGTVYVLCSSSTVNFKKSIIVETFRKGLLKLGLTYDVTSIDHLQVIHHQARLRHIFRSVLELPEKEEKRKILLRVDDFPSNFSKSEDFLKFHAVAKEYDIPYLLAITPFLNSNGLSVSEVAMLKQCSEEGVQFALHGFTHEKRYANYPSELVSMSREELQSNIEKSEGYLKEVGIKTLAFVAPFNSYDLLNLSVLTRHYDLFCGGPESTRSLGYKAGPSFVQGSLYVPTYRYAYDINSKGLGHLDALLNESKGLVLPISLHWANEVKDELRVFRKICQKIENQTISWRDYSESVKESAL